MSEMGSANPTGDIQSADYCHIKQDPGSESCSGSSKLKTVADTASKNVADFNMSSCRQGAPSRLGTETDVFSSLRPIADLGGRGSG